VIKTEFSNVTGMTSKVAVQHRPSKGPHSLDLVACWAPAHYIYEYGSVHSSSEAHPPPAPAEDPAGPTRSVRCVGVESTTTTAAARSPSPLLPLHSHQAIHVGGERVRPPPLQCPPSQPRPPRSAAGEVACLACQHRLAGPNPLEMPPVGG
jgi:hypothetical protein